MKVAIGFWGLTRSLKYTINSIKMNILDVLKENNIEYKIFLHTYSINGNYSNSRANEKNIILDNNEYKLLEPDFSFIDSQNHIMKKINLISYRTHKDPWNTNYETLNYFILAMFSKLKVTLFIENYVKLNDKFDYILFLRPDVKYLNKFDISFFNLINEKSVCIPDFHLYANFNDRFFLSNYENGLLYGKLYNNMLEYSKLHQLHSETFHNYYIRKYYNMNVILINFYFNRCRANGKERNDANDKLNKLCIFLHT
jgi:hypothetical protein